MTNKQDTETSRREDAQRPAKRIVMPLRLDELHKAHDLVKAAHAMVHAHMDNETAMPALDDVQREFPGVPTEQLICLWVGINAKDREGLV